MITLDDGHPGSYDHEAEQSPLVPDPGEAVTLICECGEWTGTGTADAEGEADEALTQAWMRHVYTATGRWAPGTASQEYPVDTEALDDDEEPAEPDLACGDLVRVARDDGGIDRVEILSVWTAARTDVPMVTVISRPFGLFPVHVRADQVLADDAPDIRDELAACNGSAVVTAAGRAWCDTHRVLAEIRDDDDADMVPVRPAPPGYTCGQACITTGSV